MTDDHLQTAFWACFGLGVLLSIGCWISAPAMGRLFESAQLPPLLAAAGLSLPFTGAGAVVIAILRRKFDFKALALRTLYGRLAGAITALALVVLGFGVWSLIAQHLVQAAFNTISVWRATPWRPKLMFHRVRLIELLSFGIMALGTRMAWVSSARLFTVLVGYFLGVTAVGYINIAQRVVDTLNDMLTGAAYNLALPIFSRQQANRCMLARTYSQATEFAALTVQPLFAGVAVCAPAIVNLFLGATWTPAIPLIQVMAVGAMLQFVLLFGEAALTALGKPAYAFAFAILSFAFVVLFFFALRPTQPIHAAAIWGLRVLVVAPFILAAVHRFLGRTATVDLLKGLIAPLVATSAMVGAIMAAKVGLLAGRSPLSSLLIEIPLGGTVYAAAMVLINRELMMRFLAFVAAGLRSAKAS